MYDYIIVGSGLYGAIFAHEAMKAGKSCLVVERRSHIGGNIYTKEMEGIQVHQYGAHIFHTSNKEVWDYIGQFATFNRYTNCPVAYYKGQMYNMPFNMNTFHKIWGVITPAEAKAKIEEQVKEYGVKEPKNLEEQAISLVGKDIYEILVKGYTEKQWGRRATELPPEIIKRLPVRLTYDNNYFNDLYQGIPMGGYTQIIEKMLEGAEVRLNVDYLKEKERVVVERKLLLEDVCEELDRKLHSLKKGDIIRIVYYDKDAYVKIEGMLADIDLEYKKRIRVVNTWIDLEDIVVIER